MEKNQTPEDAFQNDDKIDEVDFSMPSEEEYTGILGDYHEEEPAPADVPAPEEKPKKNNALKTVGIAVASAAILGCLGFLGVKLWNNPDRTAAQPETSQGEVSANSDADANAVEATSNPADLLPPNDTAAVYSESLEVSSNLMACFYHDILNQMSSAMSYYGVDPATTDLKTEKLPEQAGEDKTWFEYIMEQAKSSVEQLLVLNESANAASYTMTEEDKQTVEEKVSSADVSSYGDGVTEDDIRTMYEMQMLASSYVNHVMDEMQFTDEELQAYYEENKKSFDTCGLIAYNIYFQTEEETTSEETTDTDAEAESETEAETEMPKEDAKTLADELMAIKEHDAFEEKVKDIYLNYEHQDEAMMDTMLQQIQSDAFAYQEGFELADWAFGGTAKAGDTYMIENEDHYSVYLMTREPSRDDTATVDVRHILFMPSEDSSASEEEDTTSETAGKTLEDCRKAAEDVLAEWEAGDKSEESFGELAEKYTEDPGSKSTGGLYEGVSPGQMVTEFNDWCFDASRKPGDTGIVETSYGIHVMYFSGTGDPIWKTTAKSQLKNQNIDKWFEEQQALYPVAMNDEMINSIA